jgi:Fe-S-cluster containining protein
MSLNNSKFGRFINSFIDNDIKNRFGTCQPDKCSTLDGVLGSACCKLDYKCKALANNNDCKIYNLRPRNCRVFPANQNDLKLVNNCSYFFIQ